MSINFIIGSLLALRPGKSVVYFVGFLDAQRLGGDESLKAVELAQRLSQQGKVHLTQRRLGLPVREGQVDWCGGIGPGFEYIATGSRREEKWTNQDYSNSGLGSLTK